MRKNIGTLPYAIKHMSFSIFLFALGRGLGGDIFFSIYAEKIVNAVRLVGLLGAVGVGFRLVLSIPIGCLDDKINPKNLLIFSKILYCLCGIFYVMAGVLQSPALLMIGVIINGIASPILFTTNLSIIREETSTAQATEAFGLFHSATQAGFFVGALIVSTFIDNIPLHLVFIGVILCSFLAMMVNTTIPLHKTRGLRKSINTYIIQQNIYKKVRQDLKSYNMTLYMTLGLQCLYGLIDYIGFLFIPLLGIMNHLSLSQIAIIFAIMRIPHLLSIYFAEVFGKHNQLLVVCITYGIVGCTIRGLSMTQNFGGILILSGVIATGLSITRPILLGFIGQLIQSTHKAEITGVQETVTRAGEIVGAIAFGLIAQYSSIQRGFFITGVLLICVVIMIIVQQRQFILPTWTLKDILKKTISSLGGILQNGGKTQ